MLYPKLKQECATCQQLFAKLCEYQLKREKHGAKVPLCPTCAYLRSGFWSPETAVDSRSPICKVCPQLAKCLTMELAEKPEISASIDKIDTTLHWTAGQHDDSPIEYHFNPRPWVI